MGMEQGKHNWHRLTAEETLRQLGSQENGLSGKDASSRLRRNGYNRLFDLPRKKSTLLRSLLTDPTLLLFLFVMILSACFAELFAVLPALVLFGVWLVYAAVQAVRIDRTQEHLSRCGIPTATVFRNRKPLTVSARNVVVGDVILLQRGDVVPGDCRLISSSNLRVVFPGESETASKRTVSCKKADTVYPYQSECVAPHFENLVYAGSEIVGGTAIAVVFAVGRQTFLGTLGQPLRKDGFEKELQQIGRLNPYFKLWSFLALILLFPIGIAGLLISPDSQSGMRVFLPICAWMATASAVLPYCYVQIAVHHRIRRLFMKSSNGNGALIKSAKAMDRLPHVTDLLILGRGAISDGRRHFASAFMDDRVFSMEDEPSEMLTPLCEAFCLLENARARLPRRFAASSDLTEPYLDELVKKSRFDRETLAIRVSKTELFRGKKEQILDVEGADGAFRLRFYHGGASLFGCGHYLRANGALGILDREKRALHDEFLHHAIVAGQRTVTVVKEQRGSVVLIGSIVLGECFLRDLSKTVSRIEQKGIRVRLFLRDENEESVARAAACLPHRPIRRRSQIEDLYRVSDDERVFVGYTDQQVAERIRAWKKQGRVIAAVSCDVDDRASMAAASVSVGCDLFSSAEDARCAPILQRDSDLLVAGASAQGGGLNAVKDAIFGLQQTACSINRFFGQLFFLRILQTVVLLLSVVFGMGYIPAYAVLYCSWFMDAFLLTQTLREEKVTQPQVRVARDPSEMLKQKDSWMCALISPIVLMVVLKIFYGMAMLSLEHCYSTVFLALMLMETLLLTMGTQKVKFGIKTMRDLAFLWLPVIGVCALSVLAPKCIQVSELDVGNAISWIVLAFCVGLEAVLLLISSKKRG